MLKEGVEEGFGEVNFKMGDVEDRVSGGIHRGIVHSGRLYNMCNDKTTTTSRNDSIFEVLCPPNRG